MKLLVGVDGSQGSFEALALAARLIDPARDEIGLCYSPSDVPTNVSGAGDLRDRARQALAEAVFAEARKRLPGTFGKPVHAIVGTQKPAEGLVVAADDWRADAIVVGARGLGPIKSVLLGSVSRQVVQTSTLPVFVVRPSHAKQGMMRLLLAYDSIGAARQAQILSRFNWPPDSVGRVIRVVESLLAGPLPAWLEQQARDADAEAMAQAWVSEHEGEIQQQREELAGYLTKLPAPFHGHAPIVVEGHPADQILKTIADEKIDLVIVGKTAGGAVVKLLLGSTSARLLSHAPCSVLVIPPHEGP